MKRFLSILIISGNVFAGNAGDIINLHPYMDEQHCAYMRPCNITAKYDVEIQNHSTVGHYYKLTYKVWHGLRNYDQQIDEIHLAGGETYINHKEFTVTRMFDRNTKNTVIFDVFVTGNDHKSQQATGTVLMDS